MTLKEWILKNTGGNAVEYDDVISRYGHLKITKEYNLNAKPFPQKHFNYRNVYNWVLLEDGSAVGWNESPRNGWSFPRIGKKTVSEIMK